MATSNMITHHVTKLCETGFMDMTVFSVLQWPPQSPALNPEHLWDVNGVEWEIHSMIIQLIALQQLCVTIISARLSRITKVCFQHLGPQQIEAALRAPNKVSVNSSLSLLSMFTVF